MSEFVPVPNPEGTISPAAATIQWTSNVLNAHIIGAAGGIMLLFSVGVLICVKFPRKYYNENLSI